MGHEQALKEYYNQQAAERNTRALDPRRTGARSLFMELLRAERRYSALEIGCGPGLDGLAFREAGIHYQGVDLAEEHVRLAAHRGLPATVASVMELPFADATFDAGWTMSTLLHVPNAELGAALAEISRVLTPGAPLAVGLWSGDDTEGTNPGDTLEPQRFFSWRSDDAARRLLGGFGPVQSFETWQPAGHPSHYQFVVVRNGSAPIPA